MINYNINSVNSNLNNYKVPFKGENNSAISNPLSSNKEQKQQKELASNECAQGTRATAMAQILIGTDIKPGTTQKEYIDKLIKQGKIPNKDFYIANKDFGSSSHIIEVNNKGKRIKEVRFYDDGKIACNFINPKTQKTYKSIETFENKLLVANNDPITEEPLLDEVYKTDGSLESNAFYKKTPNGETSVNGKYQITGVDIE